MTPAALRVVLADLLSDLLGEYALAGLDSQPAINVGSPAAGITVTGLECVIRLTPEQRGSPLINNELMLRETLHVRLVQHGSSGSMLTRAVRRVLRRFPDASVTEVPENPAIGILAQRIILIPF